jgi:hypothetical protein
MKESSIENRTSDENQAEKEAVAENTAAASFFVLRVPRSNSSQCSKGQTTPFVVITTLWITRREGERIFLADGPGNSCACLGPRTAQLRKERGEFH